MPGALALSIVLTLGLAPAAAGDLSFDAYPADACQPHREANFACCWRVELAGCGTACQQLVLVHLPSERVLQGPVASTGAAYRTDSRLLVVNPPEEIAAAYGDEVPAWLVTKYYLLEDGLLEEQR